MSFVVVKPRTGGSTTVEVVLLVTVVASAVASGLAVLGGKALQAARASDRPRKRDDAPAAPAVRPPAESAGVVAVDDASLPDDAPPDDATP